VARVPFPSGTGRADLFSLLSERLAVCVPGLLPRAECERHVRGVYAGRADWTADFDGEQFSLGRAWYTHLEQDRSDEYFANARASDAAVERWCPGLQGALTGMAAALVGGDARPRPGWCGPGVHVFPAGEWVSREGGVVHFDTEGLSESHIARRGRAFTLVLMLQPPLHGGGLRVWGLTYKGEDEVDDDVLEGAEAETITYGVGDLVVIDSYRLHQIQPFGGGLDRISATVHAAEVSPGRWELWFLSRAEPREQPGVSSSPPRGRGTHGQPRRRPGPARGDRWHTRCAGRLRAATTLMHARRHGCCRPCLGARALP
jgi:hypothetical protein